MTDTAAQPPLNAAITRIWPCLRESRDWLIILLLIAATVMLRIHDLRTYSIPAPVVVDEHTNLLGAETFALGRLTNPPVLLHDQLFEMYVVNFPTRMMKYQPAMALFMAAGIVWFDHPYWGVLACMALAIGASYWAMVGWCSRPVALAGALVLMLLFRAPHYWIQSYWGGGHVFLASMLMLGAYPRIFIHHHYRAIIPASFGLVLAMLSRPLEGGVLALALAISGAITWWRYFSAAERRQFLHAIWRPMTIIIGSYIAWQMYYNYRVTGDALTLPYMAYESFYAKQPLFTFQQPRYENNFAHPVITKLQNFDMRYYWDKKQRPVGLLILNFLILTGLDRLPRLSTQLAFFAAHLPLITLWLESKKHKPTTHSILPFYICWILLCLCFIYSAPSMPHYLAPYFAVIVVMLAASSRGVMFNRLVLTACVGMYATMLATIGTYTYTFPNAMRTMRKWDINQRLMIQPGKDIVFSMNRSLAPIYNEPDIDNSEVIWAWPLSPEKNQELIDHYPDRNVWYIPSGRAIELRPYPRKEDEQ